MKSAIELGIATAIVVLRTRHLRRHLLFGLCVFSLVLVFFGVVLEDHLATSLLLFASFWFFTGTSVVLVLLLAIYDLLRVQTEIEREGTSALPDKRSNRVKQSDDHHRES